MGCSVTDSERGAAEERARDGAPYIDYLPDNADEALALFPSMARPCAECAFVPGTSANLSPITAESARECAESRCAFFCHKVADPIDHDFKTHLCAGWLTAIQRLDHLKEQP